MARTKGSITRCGHCYEQGHNKRTCPDIKKEIEARPEGYYARAESRRKSRQQPRKCSYCCESGHNRKTCGQFKMDTTEYQHMNRKFQRNLRDAMEHAGLGVGAIVCNDHWGEKKYWLVTGLASENINIANWYRQGMGNSKCEGSPYALKVKRIDLGNMSDYDRSRSYNIDTEVYLPQSIVEAAMHGHRGNASREMEILGPVDTMNESFGFSSASGMDFMTHSDYKGGYATRMIEVMKKKIEELEKA